MPQLDSTFFTSQFFWVIVCFACFYTCVHFFIVPRLRSITETRMHINEQNNTTAHMIALQVAELKSTSHAQTVQMQSYIEELKAQYDNEFQKHSKDILDAFNKKTKQSYDAAILEIEKYNKVLSEKATENYVQELAAKVVMKLTGVRT
jgi:F0F1-type ATP synthase membrane subunit b/b'